MSDNNWPDPARPGVPLNPEREGWHWVQRADKGFVPSPRIILWTDDWTSGQFSWDAIGYSDDERKLGRDFRYLGPALTFAEVDARVSEAMEWRTAIYDALIEWHDPPRDDETPKAALRRLVHTEILAVLDPAVSRPAADLVAKARREALEEAAQEMDCACPQRGAVLAKLEKDGPLSHHWPCEKSDDCCALRGAAIRALKG